MCCQNYNNYNNCYKNYNKSCLYECRPVMPKCPCCRPVPPKPLPRPCNRCVRFHVDGVINFESRPGNIYNNCPQGNCGNERPYW